VASTDEKVRFLIPVELYPPGSSTPQPPPANYLEYLRGQAAQGAKFSNVATITVDGHAATLMTATTSTSTDGSLGCPVLGAARLAWAVGGSGPCDEPQEARSRRVSSRDGPAQGFKTAMSVIGSSPGRCGE